MTASERSASDKPSAPVLLFDLGNIVNEFIGVHEIQRLWRPDKSVSEVRSDWLASPAVVAFEVGRIGPEDYARRFVEEWRIPVAPDEYLALFLSWARPPFPGIYELLDALKRRYRTACLSNTNPLHWERVGGEFGFDGYFDRQYLSFRMGLVKPERAVFEAVVADLKVAPGEILFFDDTPENVAGARAVGLAAHRVEGVAELRAKCRELGLL